jgi:hypothetical protein
MILEEQTLCQSVLNENKSIKTIVMLNLLLILFGPDLPDMGSFFAIWKTENDNSGQGGT